MDKTDVTTTQSIPSTPSTIVLGEQSAATVFLILPAGLTIRCSEDFAQKNLSSLLEEGDHALLDSLDKSIRTIIDFQLKNRSGTDYSFLTEGLNEDLSRALKASFTRLIDLSKANIDPTLFSSLLSQRHKQTLDKALSICDLKQIYQVLKEGWLFDYLKDDLVIPLVITEWIDAILTQKKTVVEFYETAIALKSADMSDEDLIRIIRATGLGALKSDFWTIGEDRLWKIVQKAVEGTAVEGMVVEGTAVDATGILSLFRLPLITIDIFALMRLPLMSTLTLLDLPAAHVASAAPIVKERILSKNEKLYSESAARYVWTPCLYPEYIMIGHTKKSYAGYDNIMNGRTLEDVCRLYQLHVTRHKYLRTFPDSMGAGSVTNIVALDHSRYVKEKSGDSVLFTRINDELYIPQLLDSNNIGIAYTGQSMTYCLYVRKGAQ